jgi:hypothetical protein
MQIFITRCKSSPLNANIHHSLQIFITQCKSSSLNANLHHSLQIFIIQCKSSSFNANLHHEVEVVALARLLTRSVRQNLGTGECESVGKRSFLNIVRRMWQIGMTSSSAASPLSVSLSAKGLKNIHKRDNDFTFVVGSRRYPCPSFVAEFLSPRIYDIHSVDDTLNEFRVEVQDPNAHFEAFLGLSEGNSVSIDEGNRQTILEICIELRNSELYNGISACSTNEVQIGNVIDRALFASRTGCNIAADLEFISSHFYEIKEPAEALKSFDVATIFEIISHLSLKISSENSLYDFAMDCISKNPDFSILLECIRFEYLSQSKFMEFIIFLSNSFEYLSYSVWESLRRRLSLPVLQESTNDRIFVEPGHRMEFAASLSALNGIVARLTNLCGGNVHHHNVVSITASSCICHEYGPYRAADLASDSHFESKDLPDSWICYDFKKMMVKPSSYTIRTWASNWGKGYQHPKSWVLEGSMDGQSWIELDTRAANDDLNDANITQTFSVSRSDEVQMIRLRLTGPNHHGSHELVITAFEIFGSLIEPPQ